MNLVLADTDVAALEQVRKLLTQAGADVVAHATDVSSQDSVQALADTTMEHFGAVHLLVNNAGVGGGGCLWELDLDYWHWVINVNLWGVIHGIRSFTPLLLQQEEAHIVNTASIAGLMSAPGTGPYTVSKHAVVSLSEMLYGEIKQVQGNVGVSVLCPSFVNTNIYASERHRPEDPDNPPSAEELSQRREIEELTRDFFDSSGMDPARVASQVFDAVSAGRFYILTHPEGSKAEIEKRMRAILDDGHPSASGPEAFPV
jgi:NAD(P)-dependent dehydrogenase (short-subunit alcohol dehydrogenase family)